MQALEMPVLTTPFEWRHVVEEDDLDINGHVNNVIYVKWLEHVAVKNSNSWGLTPKRYVELGATWVARRHTVDYLHPAYLGEELIIRTWISDFKHVTSTRSYEVVRASDGIKIAQGQTLWAFVRVDNGRPTRILPEVVNAIPLLHQAEIK